MKIEEKVVLANGVPELVLNGAGIRHKFAFFKVYIGSLYLTQKKNDNEAVFADTGPKRVSMHILSSEVTAQDLISSMNNALANNLSPHELALIEKRIRDLNTMMSSLKAINKGSVVHLDYLPDVGTRVIVDGQERITIPGEDFFPRHAAYMDRQQAGRWAAARRDARQGLRRQALLEHPEHTVRAVL